MKGARTFIDTNILVYAFTNDEPDKQEIALHTLDNCLPVISTQVLKELANVFLKKKNVSTQVVLDTLNEISYITEVVEESSDLIFRALVMHEKHGFSFYDSLIIETALAANCVNLLSEDMQDGQIISGTLKIKNPFKI